MKSLLYLLGMAGLLILGACGDKDEDDTNEPSFKTIDIVTGLDFTDANGLSIGRWKFTNDKSGEATVFPNPSNGNLFLYSLETINRVMLIPADCLNDSTTIDIIGQSESLSFDETAIVEKRIKDIPVSNFNTQMAFDFTDVPPGFYKVFYQINSGDYFWTNVYIDPSVNNFPNFDFLQGLCD